MSCVMEYRSLQNTCDFLLSGESQLGGQVGWYLSPRASHVEGSIQGSAAA